MRWHIFLNFWYQRAKDGTWINIKRPQGIQWLYWHNFKNTYLRNATNNLIGLNKVHQEVISSGVSLDQFAMLAGKFYVKDQGLSKTLWNYFHFAIFIFKTCSILYLDNNREATNELTWAIHTFDLVWIHLSR